MKLILISLLAAACSKSAAPPPTTPTTAATPEPVAAPPEPVAAEPPEPAAPTSARVELAPTAKSKSKAKGTITFREVDGGVEVTAEVEGLKPNKQHAWHIHETGDCSAPDAKSAGDHFNPGGHKHGAPTPRIATKGTSATCSRTSKARHRRRSRWQASPSRPAPHRSSARASSSTPSRTI